LFSGKSINFAKNILETMRQMISISKKKRCRQILILCLCTLNLTSCYDFDTLPDRIKSNYEFAIPVIDTTVKIGDFESLAYYDEIPDELDIPEGTVIGMGEQEYPFYIGDYSPTQEIEWLEPQLIIDSKDFPPGTEANIRIYTKNDRGEKTYFWLSEDYSITLGNTSIKVPDIPNRINDIEKFRNAQTIFLDVFIVYPVKVLLAQIADDKVNIKFGIRFAIKTDLTINL
jgi:hypothetical protein